MVMMTAHGSIESAVEAMKLGARDYLQKPFEVEELLVLARRALEDQRARTGLRYLLSERDAEFDHYGIIGRSRAILDVIARAELVAESKSTVLVTGETGTGKELVARAIHARSAQRNMPLIKVNCAAIPETLLESRAVRPRSRRVHRRHRSPRRAASRSPTAARSSSTRSARSRSRSRPSCCACCRIASSSRSAPNARSGSTCA